MCFNESAERLGAKVFLSFHLNGRYSAVVLREEIDLQARVVSAEILDMHVLHAHELTQDVVFGEGPLALCHRLV